ncbi:MAG: PAS domain S-box protein [Deltaproteobacteria bacterium]|nr:PAS domain S-box protein [Deltaproteobacteria bacterium]
MAIENALLFSEKAKIEKALNESASQWQATFDAINDAVCILDSEGRILRCNKAMSEFLGKPPGEIKGQRCWELVHCTSEPIEDCPVLLMRNTRRRETLVLPVGEKWFEVVVDPIFDKQGKITEAVHIISDITQRKLAEEELKKAHADLEKRVQARTIDLSNANILLKREIHERKLAEEGLKKTLEKLQETKDMVVQSEKLAAIGRLTASIAHEILNPINIISLRLQVLKREDALSDVIINALNVCEGQVSRIIKIIRDLARFSRAKKQEASFITSIDIHAVIEHVLNMYAPELKEKNIKTDIHYDPDLPAIPLDTDKLEQVLFNIISNSIDAMAGQETKILSIKTKPGTSKEHIRIDISDTGKGFSDEDLNKVFDPFYTTKDPGDGTGLGLYVSYGIIKDVGGKIWAENNQWGGAAFFIELPISTKDSSQ